MREPAPAMGIVREHGTEAMLTLDYEAPDAKRINWAAGGLFAIGLLIPHLGVPGWREPGLVLAFALSYLAVLVAGSVFPKEIRAESWVLGIMLSALFFGLRGLGAPNSLLGIVLIGAAYGVSRVPLRAYPSHPDAVTNQERVAMFLHVAAVMWTTTMVVLAMGALRRFNPL